MSSSKIPEILAPAGSKESFFSALNSGADAVFLGLKQFNARARAENFSVDDLRELIPLAHQYDMKVLVTLNILIKNTELVDLIDVLADLEDLEVDAIIVQDLGVAEIVRQHFPSIRMHASTQLAIHNLAGVRKAVELGFKRVVLARELTALEIKKIKQGLGQSETEIEAFCHGSLCYSYSGLCFFSGAEDARSGNRGECAYTCRKPYKVLNEPGHGFLFSMKDLNTADDLHLLVDAGVNTLKIEGRKKDAQYVSSSVKLYRKKLNEIFGYDTLRQQAPKEARNLLEEKVEEDLNWSFHRGMTSFFLKGRYHENVIDLDNPTHKGQRVGEIIKVEKKWIRVVTEKEIERFDGLRIDPQETIYHALPQHGTQYRAQDKKIQERYDNEVMQFSLRDFSIHSKPVFKADVGQIVDIGIPEHFEPRVGDIVTKIRSADLKRRVDSLLNPPAGSKISHLRYVDSSVSLVEEKNQIVLKVSISKCNEIILQKIIQFEKNKAKNVTTLQSDLHDLFSIYGTLGIVARHCEVSVEEGWFIPRSQLKEFKRQIVDELNEAYQHRVENRRIQIKNHIHQENLLPYCDKISFAAKIDRLEYLDALEMVSSQIHEVVYEPKRAFLPSINPKEMAETLTGFQQKTGIKIRLALPTVIRAWDEPVLKKWLQACVAGGICAFEVGNLGAFELIKAWGLPTTDLSSDFTLYALNSEATRYLGKEGVRKVTLSIEDDHTNMEDQLKSWPSKEIQPQVILFKDTPLFIAESCSLTALHDGCPTSEVCGYRTLEIENDEGERFYVAHEACKSIVFGKEAFALAHKLKSLSDWGVRHFRIDFLTRPYSFDQILRLIDMCSQGERIPQTHSAHFSRSLL